MPDVNSLFSRAEQAFLAGRIEEARAGLREVQRLAGPHPAVLHLLALVEAKSGAVDDARAAFEAAVRLAPQDMTLRNNFANFHGRNGDNEAALEQYDAALEIAPSFDEARFNRALLLQSLGRLDEALAELDRVAAARPGDAKTLSARGSVLLALGRLGDAADSYDSALTADPNRAGPAAGRARIAMERGEEAAPALYRRALALRPGDPELQLSLAEAMEAEGDPAAVETLAAAVAALPSWAGGQKALARMRWEAGEGRAFTRDLERAIEAAPADRALWLAYASALADADLNAEAADAAASARGAIADDPSLVLLEAIQASEALQIERADRLFALLPEGMEERSILEARHRLRTGDYARAGLLLERARAEQPWDVGTWAVTGLQWRLTADPRAEWLLGRPGLVDTASLPLDDKDLDAIAARLRSLHRTRAHPIGQSLRGGTQTRGKLFERREAEIAALKQAIEHEVGEYWDRLPGVDPAHPLLRHRGKRPVLTGSWSVRLTDGGFHVSHFHPAGALSSACYFVVPEPRAPMEGWLELGGPPGGLDVPVEPLHRIEPAPGRMALFPSYLVHGTRPFSGGERLTVAFDVAA